MEIRIETGRARQTKRRPRVIGYRWHGDIEFEVLDCGHHRPLPQGESATLLALDDEEWECEDVISNLAEMPSRRACQECPVPSGWDR